MATGLPFRDARTVGELLSGDRARLIVPEFQRGYSWGEKQIARFWKDLTEFKVESAKLDGPEDFFLGPLVLMAGDKSEGVLDVVVLDGQQRLATSTIFLSAVRDQSRAVGITSGNDLARDIQRDFIEMESGGYTLKLGETDGEYFRDTIQANEPQKKKDTLKHHANIKKARAYFGKQLQTMVGGLEPVPAIESLRELKNIVKNKFYAACIPVDSERDAFKIFETLNDRGLRLSTPDLLLCYLMRLADKSDRPDIRRKWTNIVERMGKRDLTKLLRSIWVSKYGDLKSKNLFTALTDDIADKKLKSGVFIDSVADECETYLQLLSADKSLGDIARLVHNVIHDLDCESAMSILLAAYYSLRPGDFDAVVRLVLIFVTQYSVIAGLDSAGREDVLFEAAKDIREKMNGVEKQTTPGKHCVLHVKKMLRNAAPSIDTLKAAIPDLQFSTDEEAAYILSRIATFMETRTRELRVELDESSLEHIFPRGAKPDKWGVEAIEKLSDFVLHLGNLTMLGERLNESAANDVYAIKREHYERSELAIAQEIAANFPEPVWSEQEIRSRAASFTDRILDIWNFDNPKRA